MNQIVRLPRGGFCDGQNWRTHTVIHSFNMHTTANVCADCGNVCDIENNVLRPATDAEKAPDPDLVATLAELLAPARAEWARLEAAGTPYWCTHAGREVDHPAAYWKPDGYLRADGIKMQRKHGVMCADCGGYIQEG